MQERSLHLRHFHKVSSALQNLIPRYLVARISIKEKTVDDALYSMTKMLKPIQGNDAFCKAKIALLAANPPKHEKSFKVDV